MPWGKSTVIEHIIQTIRRSGIKDIHVVVDSARQDLVDTLKDLNVQIHSADGDCEPSMLISLQTGLKNAQPEVNYAMIVLGDQPTITSSLVELIVSRIKKPTNSSLSPFSMDIKVILGWFIVFYGVKFLRSVLL